MCAAASTKPGLFVPGSFHVPMLEASRDKPPGAVQDDYAAAFAALLDGGAEVVFVASGAPSAGGPRG